MQVITSTRAATSTTRLVNSSTSISNSSRAPGAAAARSPRNRRRSPRAVLLAAAAESENENGTASPETASARTVGAPFTCRRCLGRSSPADNHAAACAYHPALYSGGEAGKAIGFVRASAEPADQLLARTGFRGLMRFWDCCGRGEAGAGGCERGWHVKFDDEENARRGWE